MDIEELMERLGRAGVTVLIKVDDERMAENGSPWTVVLSGQALGQQRYIRAETKSLQACLESVLTKLRALPGDWEWVDALL